MKKSTFFDYLNRRTDFDFNSLLTKGEEDQDYINWNDFLLPNHYGDPEQEYIAIRERAAMFDVSPIRKIRIKGKVQGAYWTILLPVQSVSLHPCEVFMLRIVMRMAV